MQAGRQSNLLAKRIAKSRTGHGVIDLFTGLYATEQRMIERGAAVSESSQEINLITLRTEIEIGAFCVSDWKLLHRTFPGLRSFAIAPTAGIFSY